MFEKWINKVQKECHFVLLSGPKRTCLRFVFPWARSSKRITLSMALYFDWFRSFCSRLMEERQTQSQNAKSRITAFHAPLWGRNIIPHTLALWSIFIFLQFGTDGDALTSTMCEENPAWDICRPKAVPFWLVPAEKWINAKKTRLVVTGAVRTSLQSC